MTTDPPQPAVTTQTESVRTHRLLRHSMRPADRALVRTLGLQLANYYAKREFSRNQWSKSPKVCCKWQLVDRTPGPDPTIVATERLSQPFHAEDIIRDLSQNRAFDHKKYDLPDPMCRWLDSSFSFSPGFHATAASGAPVALTVRVTTNLGPRFPMAPALDREGIGYTSFQGMLIKRLSRTIDNIIDGSTMRDIDSWLYDIRTLATEAVSLVENTIHQIYFKAKYDPLPGWVFDAASLGERHGRRVVDKLKWVYQITRRELNAKDEVAALVRIKTLRNHLHHFDPPSFACSVEEVAEWIRDTLLVVRLMWRVRSLASAMPSCDLIALMLHPGADFAPKDPNRRRVDPPRFANYGSTSEATLELAEAQGRISDIGYEHMVINNVKGENVL